MDSRVEIQIPFDTRVTSWLYSIQSMDTFPAIGQPERIVEISKSMRFLIKNLRTRNLRLKSLIDHAGSVGEIAGEH